MEKKELSNEELKNVNGGTLSDNEYTEGWTTCPECKYQAHDSSFNPYNTQEGCDTIKHYKCPECQHEWTK